MPMRRIGDSLRSGDGLLVGAAQYSVESKRDAKLDGQYFKEIQMNLGPAR